MEHLKIETFPRGEYNKLKLKNIGPCKVLRNFSLNSYEIELPSNLGISPIFILSYLYPFKEPTKNFTDAPDNENIQTIYGRNNYL